MFSPMASDAGFQEMLEEENYIVNPEEWLPLHITDGISNPENGTISWIVAKLGYGTFSTVWLATWNNRYVTLKAVGQDKSKRSFNETRILHRINAQGTSHYGSDFVRHSVQIFRAFNPRAQRCHTIILHEPLGMNLAQIRATLPGNVLKDPYLKATITDLLRAIDFLHQGGIIHTGRIILPP